MKHIKTYKIFESDNIRVLSGYKCPVCRGALYRVDDADSPDVTLQCDSDEAKYWNFPKGSEESNKAHDHYMRSTTVISSEDWSKVKTGSIPPLVSPDNVIDPIPFSKVRT